VDHFHLLLPLAAAVVATQLLLVQMVVQAVVVDTHPLKQAVQEHQVKVLLVVLVMPVIIPEQAAVLHRSVRQVLVQTLKAELA
jgi:hypothetical protein